MQDLLELVRDELRKKVDGLNQTNCYVSAVGAYVENSGACYVQVCDNGSHWPPGDVCQEQVSVRVCVFVCLYLDQAGRVEQKLINGSLGLRAKIAAIKTALTGSHLSETLSIPLKPADKSAAVQVQDNANWVNQDLIFAGEIFSRMY